MSRVLVVEWDFREVRGLLAAQRSGGVEIAAMFAREIPASAHNSLDAVRDALAPAIAGLELVKTPLIVAVGRQMVELRQVALPPAPAEELPEMVRLSAEQEFASLTEDDALDFLVMAGGPAQPHRLMVAVMTESQRDEIVALGSRLGLPVQRIALRAGATAALVPLNADRFGDDPVMCVDAMPQEVDLTVCESRRVTFLRTARISTESQTPLHSGSSLVNEVRRTLAAASNQDDSQRSVATICLFGDADEDRATIELLEQDLALPVVAADPLAGLRVSPKIDSAILASRGRFAALVGLACDELAGQPPRFDFLHPKQRSETPTNRRTWSLAAAAVASLVLAIAWTMMSMLSSPLEEQAELRARLEPLQKLTEKSADVEARAGEVENWLATDVNWLDQLENLSRKLRQQPLANGEFAVDDDVVVNSLSLDRSRDVGGTIQLKAVARRPESVQFFETRLRDEQHRVRLQGGNHDSLVDGYDWAFELFVRVEPDEPANLQETAQP